MLDRTRGARLLQQPVLGFDVEPALAQELHRDPTPGDQVSGRPDLTHPPHAEKLVELVAPADGATRLEDETHDAMLARRFTQGNGRSTTHASGPAITSTRATRA